MLSGNWNRREEAAAAFGVGLWLSKPLPPHLHTRRFFFVGFTILTILTIIARDNLSIQSRDGAGGMDHADIPALRRNARQNTFAPY